jgi:hypothetical protein
MENISAPCLSCSRLILRHRGYTFASFLGRGNTGQCVSNLEADQVITYAVQDQNQNWVITTKSISSRTTVAGIPVNGWVFAQETGTASTACATATPADSNSASNAGLSSGAKAGIGVGVSLGVIGLLTLLAGIWMMRRARRRENDFGSAAMTQEHDPSIYYSGTTPQSAYGQGSYATKPTPMELSEDRPTELPATSTPYSEASTGHHDWEEARGS